jgi:hypothetical protein
MVETCDRTSYKFFRLVRGDGSLLWPRSIRETILRYDFYPALRPADRPTDKMPRTKVIVLLLNAVSILSEDRFLARSGFLLRNQLAHVARFSLLIPLCMQSAGEGFREMWASAAEMTPERKREVSI